MPDSDQVREITLKISKIIQDRKTTIADIYNQIAKDHQLTARKKALKKKNKDKRDNAQAAIQKAIENENELVNLDD